MNEAKSWKDLFNKKSLQAVASTAIDVGSAGVDVFKAARCNAKLAGKILAHFLHECSISGPFRAHSFSLMGFSLGS